MPTTIPVYISRNDPAFTAEADHLGASAGIRIHYQTVQHSFGQLDDLQTCFAGFWRHLQRDGVDIVQTTADPVSGVIAVTLETPTSVPSPVQSIPLSPNHVRAARSVSTPGSDRACWWSKARRGVLARRYQRGLDPAQ
jgi:hypothetical protein